MESGGRTYSRHFSAFLVDETSDPPMPSQPVYEPRPVRSMPSSRSRSFFGLRRAQPPSMTLPLDDEIPVLEGPRAMSTFLSEGEDDDDDEEDDDEEDDDENGDENGDDDDDNDGEDVAEYDDDDDTGDLENVPVLQTEEDAQAFSKAVGGAAKKPPTNSKRAKNKAKGTIRKLRDAARRSPHHQAGDSTTGTTATTAGTTNFVSSPPVFNRKTLSQFTPTPSSTSALHRTSSSATSDSFASNGPRFTQSSSINTQRHMIRSGWLHRQGQHLKTWKRRYFVLFKRTNLATGEFSASLQYYKGSNFGKLRGEIDLHEGGPLQIRFVDVSESKKPFCFEMARGDFSLFCQGKDDEDVSAWVWHLQSLASRTASFDDTVGTSSFDSRMSMQSSGSAAMARITSSSSLGSRGIFIMAELRRLLHNSKSPEALKCKTFVKNFDCRSASSLRQLRELHASVTDSIMTIHGARMIAMAEEKAQIELEVRTSNSRRSSYQPNGREPLKLSEIRAVTSRHVEDVLYLPLQETINSFLRRAFGEDDVTLNRKLRWLQGKDQTYYNIPLHQNSWKDWRKASRMLSQVMNVALPTAKYEILVATMKEIHVIYAEEHDHIADDAAAAVENNPLETDDLIPIFTYVLANSGLDNLLALKLLLSELNGAWAVSGSLDNGAALSVFQYAVDFISSVSIPAVLEDIFRDQITLSIDGEWRHVLELDVEPTYRYGAIIRQISPHGVSTIGSSIARGHVLVTVNGQNVVLWPYTNIHALLKESSPPHRLAFIPSNSYFKILTTNKALWNVALVHACQRGDIASVQMLLANGADVNYVAHECGGNMPLHVAVSALHFNVVSYILQHGAKARTLGEYGRSALHMVGAPCTLPSPSLSAAVASASLSSGAVSGNSHRQSTLTKFRPQDKVAMIIKKLINHGTPIDSTDIFGFTPLLLLAHKGLVGGVDLLVESSGGELDLNARNWQHGMGALALAAREGHQEVVEALLDYGVQPDICNLNGDTPLHFAAAIASTPICSVLMERGCDVDVRNRDGVTPLMMAAVAKGYDCFGEMQATSPTTQGSATGGGGKARHKVQRMAKQVHVDEASVCETIECLIDAGADLNAGCNVYRLPLHYAAMYGGQAVYNFIGSKMVLSVDAHRRDLYGKTPSAIMDEKSGVTGSACDAQQPVEEDENEIRESQMELQSDFQLLVTSTEQQSTEKVERREDLVVEIVPDTSTANGTASQRLVVSGTLKAICDELYQFDNYKLDDVAALISTCTVASYRALITHLREALKQEAAVNGPDQQERALYVRRMVLHSVDLMVQSFMQKVQLDTEICSCIHEFCTELFPFKLDDDPPCGQWLSTSLLPMFSEAVRMQRLYELRVVSPCEAAYETLKAYLKAAKKLNPSHKFLDDDLFASTFGVEVITEAMRRRLSIAGVWHGEATQSFCVRPEPGESPSVLMNRKTLSSSGSLPRGRSSDRVPRMWLLEVDVSVLADQITLFQHYLFSQIRVSELLESKRSAEKTPAYDRLRQLHNHISVWVVSQILSRDDVDQRAQILAHFIDVAATCLQPLQNFDGFMAIMNATNDSSIFRLKKTWSRLPPQVRDRWHELKKYTESGARSMHKLMKDAVPPMVPYLGVVMQNIIAIQEFPDKVEGDLINFKKIRLLGAIVKRFTTLQTAPYLLQVDKRVLDQLCATLQYPDADLSFQRSLKIEPRIPTS